ncbi:hypothetical protein [Amycolatopsis aidingensis]|uniref:hypothetical protein n=1 Tax=Amycolatopsis aidingensis TaxID=2842453 RepID=UPI001C0C6C4C|nr:hypothetical protein [Amycolatopsis aidingensis]
MGHPYPPGQYPGQLSVAVGALLVNRAVHLLRGKRAGRLLLVGGPALALAVAVIVCTLVPPTGRWVRRAARPPVPVPQPYGPYPGYPAQGHYWQRR